MKFLKILNNFVFQDEEYCLVCKEEKISNYYLCKDCNSRLEFVNKTIDIESPYIEYTYYSLFYNRFLRKILHEYKFQKKSYLYKVFGAILSDYIVENQLDKEIDYILYVPIHRRKESMRGYNQVELLGDYISNKLEISLLKGNLIKDKWTLEQNKLDKYKRLDNLKGSFAVKNKEQIENKRLLLLDDFVTTGTTMEECSKVLIKNGAKKIIGLALSSSKRLD